jgi:outer membrane protein OmpA-like peptidoglycan-associated protein
MYEAEQALRKAEKADDVREMEHLAYIAERKAQIAVALAEQKIAENERERLAEEKDKILLDAREYEINQIRKEADSMAHEAEQARQTAESKTREIEHAKGKAEALALQAEKARKEAETRALEAEKSRLLTEQAVAQRKQLESEIAELKAKQTDRGIILTLGDILFETGKDNLLPGAVRTIDQLVEFLNKYPNRNILIEGHTDSVGGEIYNLGLSQRRADAVRSALISKGISAQRITTKGYGKKYPIAGNSTQAGRQQNRRVEVVILNEGVNGEKMLR